MAITLTERAAAEVARVKQEQNLEASMFLRIGIMAGGCSGFNYRLHFDNQFDETKDTKYECHGVEVVVDKKSGLYLDGTIVDWYEDAGRRGFSFDNPNVVRSCACGMAY